MRSRRRRRVLIVVALAVVLVAASWTALGSPWSTVQRVDVTGTHRISVSEVQAAGESEVGHALLLARVKQVQSAVARDPLVKSVTVSRHWPSVLRIQVVERQPVVAVPLSRQLDAPAQPKGTQPARYRLVDADGVTIDTVVSSGIPAGMPTFKVDVKAQRGVAALQACLTVSKGLPATLSNQVTAIGASSPDGVWLDLRSGARVQWGDATQGALKAQVLAALLKQKATSYDLRSPQTPAVRLS